MPTNELNDLHVDNKGYLWIAHSLGISRYDGLKFTTYSHPAQINLHYTDIIEDQEGKIWCHNISGQVFYVENGKIQLLKSYPFLQENQNPKMALCGDKLLITSYKGVFVCNTKSLKTSFFPFQHSLSTASVSIGIVKNQAVICNSPDWYIYSDGQLKKTAIANAMTLSTNEISVVQKASYNDTIFLTTNPSGVLYKLVLTNGKLHVSGRQEFHDYINTVAVDSSPWVHTRHLSLNLKTGVSISGLDLNDVVTGKDGVTWCGSRRNGLLMNPPPRLWQPASFRIDQDDYIRSLNANAGYFFAGTQTGTLYQFLTETTKPAWKQELFNGLGSIDFLRYINHDLFVVGSSTETYIVDANEKRITATLPMRTIKDVDFDGSNFYVATPQGLFAALYDSKAEREKGLAQQTQNVSPVAVGLHPVKPRLLLPQHTSSVRFDSVHRCVYAATKNGLVQIGKKGIQPVLFQGKNVFATALSYKQSRLYVSTVNDGLWILEGKNLLHFTTANMLASNSIIRIKLTEDHLWLFEKNGIQVLDIHTKRILENLDMPKVDGANVLDVAEKGDYGYLATATGVYRLPLNVNAPKVRPTGYLDYVIINGQDTVQNNGISLSHRQNDLQFYFSSPSFADPENISFRYRLKGVDNEWQVTSPGERMIRYSALLPGNYIFELYAISNNGLSQTQSIHFSFQIAKPWWRTWWFYFLLNGAAVAVIYLLIRNHTNQKLRLELVRRNISSDLHDDIGATLSSVNFYLDLARSDTNNADYLHYIKQNVNQVINSLDDLVWSINPRNDSTGQLIHHMRDYAIPLLKAANMNCQFTYEPKLVAVKLDLETKRNLYLLFKEMVNNVAKHAQGQNCSIDLRYRQGRIVLTVTDDGQGFDPEKKKDRNGLFNMHERTQKLRGELAINSAEKKGSRVVVSVPV